MSAGSLSYLSSAERSGRRCPPSHRAAIYPGDSGVHAPRDADQGLHARIQVRQTAGTCARARTIIGVADPLEKLRQGTRSTRVFPASALTVLGASWHFRVVRSTATRTGTCTGRRAVDGYEPARRRPFWNPLSLRWRRLPDGLHPRRLRRGVATLTAPRSFPGAAGGHCIWAARLPAGIFRHSVGRH